MEWYAWLFLILFVLTGVGFILYYFLKPDNKRYKDIQYKVKEAESKYRELKNKLTQKAVENKSLQKKIKEMELKELEDKYAVDLAVLNEKEKKQYEKVKQNPQDGIDFISNFINNN